MSWLPRRRLRVLYALPSYPQLSETYMHNELLAVQRAGAEVEVWSGRKPTAPSDEELAPIHRGPIADAIRAFAPQLVHVHWLIRNEEVLEAAGAAGLPVTVRAHSFDFSLEALARVEAHPAVGRVYLFPHQLAAAGAASSKARALDTCFDPARYGPARKDRDRVLRAGVARPEQDHAGFLRIAARLSGFRCELILAHGHHRAEHHAWLRELNRELGKPAKLRANLQYREVAPRVRRAAIYLHTTLPSKPYGQPTSIAEAMATGSWILTPDVYGASGYVGDAGVVYRSEDEAVELIAKTASFGADDWRRIGERSLRRAREVFSPERVGRTLLADWRRLAA